MAKKEKEKPVKDSPEVEIMTDTNPPPEKDKPPKP